MDVETDTKSKGRNPQSFEEASRLVKRVESLFMPWDFEGLLAGFTDDCIVRYAEFPEMHGKEELDKFFRGRAARQEDYWLKKDLRLWMGDMDRQYVGLQLDRYSDRQEDVGMGHGGVDHAGRQDRRLGRHVELQ